ncbi:MFS transporter [Rhodococcus sp. WS3]|uniref:MFS transporter n=1 Tax=unclassified Rhodococcus (in: high G+C Gram-positive bacteria) TaxID=192944 RepID=UPI0005E38FBA|nr:MULTISPECIES: MFS transporter [unclassified Rhodococcus (in: high G+C Gram-positive bacteria)]KJF19259.1 Quinolone resistance protein norB [Rhodococcus sp. AD45]ROZ42775.1 MFS transporter [Rhodococcus sp. WS3]RZL20973.1 MAG: MFS transporter [Rhodococcus sp. (in: high G+C Gram-positive bacteria)]
MSAASPPTGSVTPLAMRASAVVGFLVFVEFASGFVQGFYIPVLSAIAEHTGVSDAKITWFGVVQTLGAAVSVPILAKLGDIFGHRRILRIAVLSVLTGTVLVAVTSNYELMLIGRLLIGPLAVWLPLEVALVHHRIKGEIARKSIGLLVSALTIGAVIGGITSGIAATVLPSITWVLLIPVAVVAVAVFAVYFGVPESVARSARGVDYIGFAGLALVMILTLWGLHQAQSSGFGSAASILPLLAGMITLPIWAAWELRVKNPAVDLRLMRSRQMWPIYLTTFLVGTVVFGSMTILPTFLASNPDKIGYGFALAPNVIALFTAGAALAGTVGAASFALLAKWIGMRRTLILATTGGAVGNFAMAFAHNQIWQIWVFVGITGYTIGILMAALPALIAETAPSDQTGIATGLYNSLKTLGGSSAGAVFGLVLAAYISAGNRSPDEQGYVLVWLLCAAAFGLCPLVLSFLRGQPDSPSTVSTSKNQRKAVI